MLNRSNGNAKNNAHGFTVSMNAVSKTLPLIMLLFISSTAYAQFGDIFGFGKNKVHYKTFEWSVIKTEHFDLYFYEEERRAALDAAEIAERSYAYLSETLDYKFKQKIPLLLYASHNDFQQTNAIQSFISEGTQGVTESLKGRMILPITGSYGQFIHVLTHEMVHAFQFDIMLADGPSEVIRRFNPPLWFIEGMAEYLSVGMDNITRMWMRDAVLNNTLLSIPEMTFVFDIRVYRMGQAIWYYVGERYGKEVVGRIFKTARATADLNRAFKAHTGLDLVELSKRWQDDARARYLPQDIVLKKPEEVAEPIADPCYDCTSLNIVPAISPDGQNLAYIGDKNFTLNMFLRGLVKNENGRGYRDDKIKKVVQSGSSQSYETLRYFTTSMNWSPDGKQFSFVAKAGKTDAIYIVDARKNKVIKKLSFEKLTGMAAPSWSPNGDKLVFSGTQGGISDLYLADANGEQLRRLTNNRHAHLHPQWSPDGKKIAFTTDRGPNTDVQSLIFGNYNIALYDLQTGEVELLTKTGGNHINPVWSKDGDEVLFISDMSGIPNIYALDLESRQVYRITNFITGVSGIITESPAITLAPETGRLAFSAFSNAGWYIYTLDEYERVPIDSVEFKVLGTLEDPNDKYREFTKADSAEFLLSAYKSKLTPDIIVGGGAFATNVGFAGQTAFLFSDMLGDKNLLIQAALFGDPLESTVIATYFNQRRRLNWSFSAFQFRDDFGFFTSGGGVGFQTQIFRGVGIGAALPFNPFTRLEFSTNVYFVDRDVVNFITAQDNPEVGNAFYTGAEIALVRDTAFWGFSAPISGTRARFSVRQNIGDLRWTLAFADYRKYIPLHIPRVSIAYRLSAGTSTGPDRRLFGIGGPFTFRGKDFGELRSTRAIFQNVELRFPAFPFLPMQYDFLTAVAFFDATNVWGRTLIFRDSFLIADDVRGFDIDNTLTSYGLGIRFNLGGLLVLRWDFPLKHEDGAPGTFFSIGIDY
ncbi:MAG: peptidase MA family metallohydrolase [bacterium]